MWPDMSDFTLYLVDIVSEQLRLDVECGSHHVAVTVALSESADSVCLCVRSAVLSAFVLELV